MGKVSGSMSLPVNRRASQLINDVRFSSIREYVLNSESLSGSTQLDIDDIPANAIIYRIELIVLHAFSTLSGDQHNISITCDNGGTLMESEWNDPNMVGSYATNCYTTVRGNLDLVHVIHSLSNIATGFAILRLHLYTDETDDYSIMETNDAKDYLTLDKEAINVVN